VEETHFPGKVNRNAKYQWSLAHHYYMKQKCSIEWKKKQLEEQFGKGNYPVEDQESLATMEEDLRILKAEVDALLDY